MESPGFFFTVLMFLALIGPLVAVHEFGHYLMGRLFGTKVESFSLGFGKQLLSWTDKRGTVWQVAALPLGGYVKFAGDANAAGAGSEGLDDIPAAERGDYFAFKPLWQRALIVVAGPAINFIFAILIFAGFAFAYGQENFSTDIAEVQAGSAAESAGIEVGDRVVAFDGVRVENWRELTFEIIHNPGLPAEVVVEREGQTLTLEATPTIDVRTDTFGNESRVGLLGILPTGDVVGMEQVGVGAALAFGVEETWRMLRSIVRTLGHLLTGDRSIKELGGPLKIGKISGEIATFGVPAFVTFMAFVSINLGFINLLPIPMLDGGHLALYGAEAIRGQPLPERAQQWAFMAGFALVVTFMFVVTVNDLASFGVWQHAARLFG